MDTPAGQLGAADGPRECAWAEAVLSLLVDAGWSLALAADVLLTVNSYVRGASVPVDDRLPASSDVVRSGRGIELPHLLGLLTTASDADPCSPFERGLQRVLAGVVDSRP